MQNLISVIIPVYNVEKYLEKCIQSVVNQTYKNLEIILVNDGSPDNSLSICEKYAGIDNRIKVINKENGGLSSARNAGVEVATGDYIGFVDSDDYIYPDMYKTLLNRLLETESDLSICGYDFVDENGVIIEGHNCILKDEVCRTKDIYTKFLNPNYFYFVTAWNKLYKKELFKEIRFPEGKLHEDELTAHLFFDKSKKIVCCKEKLYSYVQREGSIMGAKFSVKRLAGVEAILTRMDFFIDKGLFYEAVFDLNRAIYLIGLIDAGNSEVENNYRIDIQKHSAKRLYNKVKDKTKIPFKLKIKFGLFFRDSLIIKAYYKYKLKRI